MAQTHRVLEGVGLIHRHGQICLFLHSVVPSRRRPPAFSSRCPHTIWSSLPEAFRAQPLFGAILGEVTDAESFRGCGLSFARVLVHPRPSAQAAEHGRKLEPGRVMRMDHVERTACLTKIPGIGPWTADMIRFLLAATQTSGPTVIWSPASISRSSSVEAVEYRSRRLEVLTVAITACHGHVEGVLDQGSRMPLNGRGARELPQVR